MGDHLHSMVEEVVVKVFQAVTVALDTMMAAALSVDHEASIQASAAILEFALDFIHTFENEPEEEEAEDDSRTER